MKDPDHDRLLLAALQSIAKSLEELVKQQEDAMNPHNFCSPVAAIVRELQNLVNKP